MIEIAYVEFESVEVRMSPCPPTSAAVALYV